MRDATGRYESALVLGGTSDLARAVVEKLVTRGTRHVILAGRRPAALENAAAALARDGVTVTTAAFHGDEHESHEHALDALWPTADVDIAILAFGELGDEAEMTANPEAAARLMNTNMTGGTSALLELTKRMTAQGHGTIVVFSSVAGQRPRSANPVYGASKAGLDALAQGLSDRIVGSGVDMVIVRPGFVHTKMTEGRDPAPFATTADKVADDVIKGLDSGAAVVWSPAILKYVFAVFKLLPRPIWRKISARG